MHHLPNDVSSRSRRLMYRWRHRFVHLGPRNTTAQPSLCRRKEFQLATPRRHHCNAPQTPTPTQSAHKQKGEMEPNNPIQIRLTIKRFLWNDTAPTQTNIFVTLVLKHYVNRNRFQDFFVELPPGAVITKALATMYMFIDQMYK